MTVYRYKIRSSRSNRMDRVVGEMRKRVDKEIQESDYSRRKVQKAVEELRRKNTY